MLETNGHIGPWVGQCRDPQRSRHLGFTERVLKIEPRHKRTHDVCQRSSSNVLPGTDFNMSVTLKEPSKIRRNYQVVVHAFNPNRWEAEIGGSL